MIHALLQVLLDSGLHVGEVAVVDGERRCGVGVRVHKGLALAYGVFDVSNELGCSQR